MRRVLPIVAAAAVLLGVVAPARADCAQDITTMQTRLATLDDSAKRHELELLLAKAQDDSNAGRAKLCADDLRHAEALAK